jgi:hypothetical protein
MCFYPEVPFLGYFYSDFILFQTPKYFYFRLFLFRGALFQGTFYADILLFHGTLMLITLGLRYFYFKVLYC